MSAQTWITIITAIISTGTAIFLAIITWRYVRLTREYVRLTQEMLENTYKPEVIIRLLKTKKHTPMKSARKRGKTGYLTSVRKI